ncbi:WD40 repeat-like protein [Pholiota conissans]|uniref:WD40 repeat-like protein n=1 Tax=Pholiota conissans TaxID=109636 RepID=A0A9P6D4D7_9AGAR|nr:WD40 repeat-like protein [Pholiota conissans]
MGDFHVPLTFPNVSFLRHSDTERDATRSILEKSLAESVPTSLECWEVEESHDSNDPGHSGVIIGCQDGTVYVLSHSHQSFGPIEPLSPHVIEPARQSTTARHPKSSHSNSGSPSPISASFTLSPTFNVTAKPRVVSGVTTEPVEAPKNYVDFEDEPDKLKDILKGRNPKDRRSVSETHSDKGSKAPPTPPIVEPAPIVKRKSRAPRSLLSAANSRAPTPPFSIPSSPQDPNLSIPCSQDWSLRYHIMPSRAYVGSAARTIRLFNDNHLFAVLQENGALFLYSVDDGSCIASMHIEDTAYNPSTSKDMSKRPEAWFWRNLSVIYIEGSTVLVAMAENDGSTTLASSDADNVYGTSRCAVIELIATPSDTQLRLCRQWEIDGPINATSFYEEQDGTIVFFHVDHNGHLMNGDLKLRFPSTTPQQTPPLSTNHHSNQYGSHLPIPNPFKSLMSRSSERLSIHEVEEKSQPDDSNKTWISTARDLGVLLEGIPLGLRGWPGSEQGSFRGAAWTHQDFMLYEATTQTLSILFQAPMSGVEDVCWLDHSTYIISFEQHAEIYQVKHVNADNDTVDPRQSDVALQTHAELVHTIQTGSHQAIKLSNASMVLTRFSEDIQEIVLHSLSEKILESSERASRILWHCKTTTQAITLTSMLPLDLEHIIQGYSDGYLRQFSLAQMARKSEKISSLTSSSMKTSNQPIGGSVVGLHIVQNLRTRDKFVVGGGDDGSIAFWSLSTFELAARWTVFTTPLVKVMQFEAEKTGPLRGCALCISRDGSIAVIVIDDLHFLYLIPGSTAPLERVCLGGNNLLLVYRDRRVRLWDAQTKELWRSMGEDKAEEMLSQGGWTELNLQTDACIPKLYWSSVTDWVHSTDIASSLDFNIERFLVDAISITKSISTSKDEVRGILLTLDRLRLVLSVLLIPGLNPDVDSICYGKLGVHPSSTVLGLASDGTTTLYDKPDPLEVWCWSPTASASRALAIISVLRAMSLFEELTEGANTVISFFTTSLGMSVGPRFRAPSVEYLGKLWFGASNEFRHSIRFIFDAAISNLSDEESINVAEKWQHHVPSLQPDAEKETLNAALALFICGCVAAEKYSLLSTNALMDISRSITLYLHDEKSIYRVLAIDLCSRGFNVWQHYIDAMEILRSLFDLATNVRKDSISIQNVSAQARLAVLSIASNNMALFMGTLCLDILTPPTMEHRRSVLQILAFLIRKRPFVLQPNLPRLMEAVVKSLDPNSTADRDLVLDTATEIIGYVVKTYPTVDFHMATQRLAVGTNEGAVIMYDLKTAIRLYVLEGHKKPITALSFSPDGRRLVTISLKESVVLAWKVGSSFASFFNPGAPPRQGHGGSQPFKTLNFNVGAEAEMSAAQTLDLVKVEWVADRSVKVKIRHSVLTFST